MRGTHLFNVAISLWGLYNYYGDLNGFSLFDVDTRHIVEEGCLDICVGVGIQNPDLSKLILSDPQKTRHRATYYRRY